MIKNQLTYINFSEVNDWQNTPTELLGTLKSPTVIDVKGCDSDKWRVVVNLIHGNEPSGFIAMHRWLKQAQRYQQKPLTNIRFIVASVEAAQEPPIFTHRYLPQGRDLNRCFGKNEDDIFCQRAHMLCEAISEVSPELIVDLHNTSGFSPAFSVAIKDTKHETALVSLFCQTLIYSDFRLGGLMEQDFNCTIVTIECGGNKDQQAHEIAFQGIDQLSRYSNIENCHHLQDVEVYAHPQRVRLRKGLDLCYDVQMNCDFELTLNKDIEQMNFGTTSKGRTLGWIRSNTLDNIGLINPEGENVIADYFIVEDNRFKAKTDLRIFMATPVKNIALTDCLFYVLKTET